MASKSAITFAISNGLERNKVFLRFPALWQYRVASTGYRVHVPRDSRAHNPQNVLSKPLNVTLRVSKIGFVSNTIFIDSQNPSRTATPKPIWRPLNRARRDQIIALTVFHILIKSRYMHSFNERYRIAVLVDRGIFMRQAQQLTEQTVEVGSQLH